MKNVLLLSLTILGFVAGGCTRAADTASSPIAPPSPNGALLKGTVDGGGGKGVVCQSANGTETVKTLDLFESETIRGEGTDPEISSATTIEEIAFIAARKVGDVLAPPKSRRLTPSELKKLVDHSLNEDFDDRLRPQRTSLSETIDATLPPLPSNCRTVQIAIWEKSGEIALDLDLWDKLEIRDRAALKIHEYFYARAREDGATDSDQTRWLTGSAFSNIMLEPRYPASMSDPGATVVTCFGGGGNAPYDGPVFEIYAQEEVEYGVVGTAFYLQYTQASKSPVFNSFTRVRAFAAAHTLAQLTSGSWPASIKFRNSLRNYDWIFESTNVSSTVKIQDPAGQIGLSYTKCRGL